MSLPPHLRGKTPHPRADPMDLLTGDVASMSPFPPSTATSSKAEEPSPAPSKGPDAKDTPAEKAIQLKYPHDPSITIYLTDFINYFSRGSPGQLDPTLQQRPGFGTDGKAVMLPVNAYAITQYPNKDVWQYDVLIGSGSEKRGLIAKVWHSPAVQQAIGQHFIWDGNKIGWSMQGNLGKKLKVNLDDGKQPRTDRAGNIVSNEHRVELRATKRVRLDTIRAYLTGQGDFKDDTLEAINFLDHVLREHPAQRLFNFRRAYFPRTGGQKAQLTGGVEAVRGVYQSIRTVEGAKLVINADASNTVFWMEQSIDILANDIVNNLDNICRNGPPNLAAYKILKRLSKNKFIINHGEKPKQATINGIAKKNANNYIFETTDRATGKTSKVSIAQYFLKKYNIKLQKPQLPLIETMKRGEVYPMELCKMAPNQRYPSKLNERQTSAMMTFAAGPPTQRRAGIQAGLQQLNWANDPILKGYGMKVNPQMITTKARILPAPQPLFGKGQAARPGYTGRWDLRGKVFYKNNDSAEQRGKQGLKSWGVLVLSGSDGGSMQNRAQMPEVTKFIDQFCKAYKAHGGIILNDKPVIHEGEPETLKAIEQIWLKAGNQSKLRPQMIMVMLTNKNADIYNRVKANFDCRWGVVSQCVQAINVKKCQPQYISNVLTKFNCKLGGFTSLIKSGKGTGQEMAFWNHPESTKPRKTMIIGADVSHPPPGITRGSMAAITVSMDLSCARYAAGVQTNGFRVEMVSQFNIHSLVTPLLQYWMENVGEGRVPDHVYYFRDGVSEAQFKPLIENEVADLKNVFLTKCNGALNLMPKFTVVVAEKRHHIRFFPNNGTEACDKNGNPVPGVLVDRDVTSVFEHDIYLNAHSAIKGTSRPTHYTMIMDEAKVPINTFQKLLYEHCYMYQRATTPVSLFPAVYYAHLAAARAESHIDRTAEAAWEEQFQRIVNPGQPHTSPEMQNSTEVPLLKPMQSASNGQNITYAMWYI